MIVNPLLLVDQPMRIKFEYMNGNETPAYVDKKGPTFHITINTYVTKKVPSKIRKYFELGLIYHEIAHIKYLSFKHNSFKNDIHQWIDNLLEDARVEYKCTTEFPIVAKFISVALNVTRKINSVFVNYQKQDGLAKMLNDMYSTVRYGIIPDDADEDFINFMFPLFLVSMRGEREQTAQAAEMIYNYLMADFDERSDVSMKTTVVKDTIKDNKKIEGETIIDRSTNDINKQVKELINELEQSYGDSKRDIDDIITDVLHAAVEDSKFYKSCVREMSQQIAILTNVLRSLMTKHTQVPVFDGDLNIKQQMQAYLDNIIGEQNKTYTYNKVELVNFDCLILRDISGSTINFKFDYFKALVTIVESLENFNLRYMVVDFSDNAVIVKEFDEEKDPNKFKVNAFGDTRIVAALNAIKDKVNWKAKCRLIIVITDGMFSDACMFNHILGYEKYNDHSVNWVIINIGNIVNNVPDNMVYSNVCVKDVREIPQAFAKIIHQIRF